MTWMIIIKQLVEVCNQDTQEYIEDSDKSDRFGEIQEAAEDQLHSQCFQFFGLGSCCLIDLGGDSS
jgi:hypothetical protein